MSQASVILEHMAKNKQQSGTAASGKPKPPKRAPHRQYNLRIKPMLAKAFDDYVDSVEPGTTATAVIEMLLRNHLSSLGLWPVKSAGEPHGP